MPLPVCGGWDSRPWHGENNLVRFGRTPELFDRHLLDARQFFELQNTNSIQKAVLVEAWNEWGEGSYIEPHCEFGFGYLDKVREVFADDAPDHEDITPTDVELGPYDVTPPAPERTTWEFDHGDDGWGNTMHISDLKTGDGVLRARTVGNDPAFFGPPMQARASEFGVVSVRLRLTRGDGRISSDGAQLFWRATRLTEGESTSESFRVETDGHWHEYRISVRQNPRWRGNITRLRLDPGTQQGITVDLDYIRLEK